MLFPTPLITLVISDLTSVVDVCYAASANCPKGCECRGKTVDCSNKMLTKIPHDLPKETEELLLNDNDIQRIPALGLFNRCCENYRT